MARATFGAGCFWGVEELFRRIEGVTATAVGYMGGKKENPTYQEVCTDKTGHAEVVDIEFEPSIVSYEELLNIFWENHNPTTLNRQGPDMGSQYRSVVFYHTPEQMEAAEKAKRELDASGSWKDPIVTVIEEAPTFYRGEEYHQRYLQKRSQSSCQI
ncbi:peptide-methionine (S)-S-oxide reductase [Marininema mesophilum]|uniref:Peptide methionine sulfoxide reductase MsrA n=1 Tax=Marininema mesophilum TaxID=1048340 RepID=A0A1H3A0J0_9BACL|nr:peptide-methionine (S)-S-oxide reductase MsrA [Marininema mesophilum]SDX22951.1 peptide-methionine (S)-S-oxide reductase [Marininema mesophilum]